MGVSPTQIETYFEVSEEIQALSKQLNAPFGTESSRNLRENKGFAASEPERWASLVTITLYFASIYGVTEFPLFWLAEPTALGVAGRLSSWIARERAEPTHRIGPLEDGHHEPQEN